MEEWMVPGRSQIVSWRSAAAKLCAYWCVQQIIADIKNIPRETKTGRGLPGNHKYSICAASAEEMRNCFCSYYWHNRNISRGGGRLEGNKLSDFIAGLHRSGSSPSASCRRMLLIITCKMAGDIKHSTRYSIPSPFVLNYIIHNCFIGAHLLCSTSTIYDDLLPIVVAACLVGDWMRFCSATTTTPSILLGANWLILGINSLCRVEYCTNLWGNGKKLPIYAPHMESACPINCQLQNIQWFSSSGWIYVFHYKYHVWLFHVRMVHCKSDMDFSSNL